MTHDYAAIAARVLRHKPVAVRATGLSRDRGIAIVAQAMEQSARARRRRRLWTGGTFVTVAAAAAVALVFIHEFRPKAVTNESAQCKEAPAGCTTPATSLSNVDVGHWSGRDVLPGVVIQSDQGRSVEVRFESGTRISLDENTRLTYEQGSSIRRFSLSRGTAHLEVAKLKPGQRFLVDTASTEVEVRGTVFDVSVVPASAFCQERTSVSVKEGVVEVRSANELRTLRNGDVWQPDCVVPDAAGEPPVSAARLPDRAVKTQGAESARRTPPRSPAPSLENQNGTAESAPTPPQAESIPSSDLGKQNDIYARASAARNQGRSVEALELYQELISKFPTSALVESSYVQRMRILRDANAAAAAREAKQYLSRFPKGFARSEAESLAGAP